MKINFFLYAITGKAFRHELKRLFRSIGLKMHLIKEAEEPTIDRRLITNTNNTNNHYQMNDSLIHQQRRISGATIQLLRCRTSIDSCISNGTILKRHV